MKKFIVICVSFVMLIGVAVCIFNKSNTSQESSYLRIHVRANSNSENDQRIKYEVKEAVVDYLTPKIAEGSTFQQAYNILNNNLEGIEQVANDVLKKNGYSYLSKASLRDEYFPTRSYGDCTLENGYYDALILELGEGCGDNWWCVVYPPLCFIGSEGTPSKNIIYKSKFAEIIKKFFS